MLECDYPDIVVGWILGTVFVRWSQRPEARVGACSVLGAGLLGKEYRWNQDR